MGRSTEFGRKSVCGKPIRGYTVAALRFAAEIRLQIVPLSRNSLALSATGGASAASLHD